MTLAKAAIIKKRQIVSVRELAREDLAIIVEPRAKVEATQKLRDPHHRLARLVASGIKHIDVVAKSGYSMNRLSQLLVDPAFNELVSHYRGIVTEAYVQGIDDYYELATTNMLKAERQIAEKLEEADEEGKSLPTRDLIAISRDAADRFGYGKRQMNLNVNVDFAAQLERTLERSRKAGANVPMKTLESTVVSHSISGDVAAPPTHSPRQGLTPSATTRGVEQPQPIRRRA